MDLVYFLSTILSIIDTVIVPLIFAIALLTFVWGVYEYFIAGGADEEKRKQGRNFIMYGLIGFFVMISVWGLVNLLLGTFALDNNRPTLPSSLNDCVVEIMGVCID